jgi:hypothetical protein
MNLNSEKPLSSFAFNFNMRRCTTGGPGVVGRDGFEAGAYTCPLFSST